VTRIIVVGIPRSGTTWVATMLAHAQRTTLVPEPDNHNKHPFALRAKRPLPGGFHTALDRHEEAPAYERLWREAFGEHGSSYTPSEVRREALARRLVRGAGDFAVRRSFMRPASVDPRLRLAEALAVPRRPPAQAEHQIVKSVYAALSLEWLAARLDAQFVIVLRDLVNVVSSWVELDWVGAPPDEDELAVSDPPLLERLGLESGLPAMPAQGVARVTWLLGLLSLSLRRAADAHRDWHAVRHEELIEEPARRFRELAVRLGLEWSAEADAAVAATDAPGSRFAIKRSAATLPDVWRSRLSADQVAQIRKVIDALPHE
jgi:Sulfotransferase family